MTMNDLDGPRYTAIESLWNTIPSWDPVLNETTGVLCAVRRDQDAARRDGGVYITHLSKGAQSILTLMLSGVSLSEVISRLVSRGCTHEDALSRLESGLRAITMDSTPGKRAFEHEFKSYGKPVMASWDITLRCNMTCTHCLNPYEDTRELTTKECLSVVDQLADYGVAYCWMGGGEPTLRADLVAILDAFRKRKVKLILATNGVRIARDPGYGKEVASLADEIAISLDGTTPEMHGVLRKPEKTFYEAVNAIKLASRHSVVKVHTVVHRENMESIENIVDLAYDSGAHAWGGNGLVPQGRGHLQMGHALTYEERQKLHDLLRKKRREYYLKMKVLDYVPLCTMDKVYSKPHIECAAGHSIVYISAEGNVFPCSMFREHAEFNAGSLRTERLRDLWENGDSFRWLRALDVENSLCNACSNLKEGRCNTGCKALKVETYGSAYYPDPDCAGGDEIVINTSQEALEKARVLGSHLVLKGGDAT